MQAITEHVITYRKGWTPWGVPCSIKFVDGHADSATTNGTKCPFKALEEAEKEADDDQ